MAFTAAVKNISLKRGDTYTFRAQLNRVDEVTEVRTPYDLSGFSISGQARYTADSSNIWIDFANHGLDITDPANGVFQFKILGADSERYHPAGSTEPNSGVYDIQFSKNVGDANKEQIITYVTGTFTITDDVTRNTTPRDGESSPKVAKKSNFVAFGG